MAVVAVPFILYLVRFCSSKSCTVIKTSTGTFSGFLLFSNKKLGFCVLLKSSSPLMDDLFLPLVLIRVPVQYGSFLQPQSNSLAAWPGHA